MFLKKFSLLIVEDEVLELKRLERSFLRTELPCRVLRATNRIAALNQFRRHKPEVVILDLSLNGEGPRVGLDLVSAFAKINSSARMIVLTGHTDAEICREALRRGAASFMNKPADFSSLQALVADYGRSLKRRQPKIKVAGGTNLRLAVENLERQMIVESLDRNQNTLTAVCEELGIGRTTLWRKIRQYRLNLPD